MINVRNIKATILSLMVLDLDTKTMYNNNPETEIKMRADQFNTYSLNQRKERPLQCNYFRCSPE